MITMEQVKELRDTTGLSIMQCKKALEEANGDMAKALVLLQKKGASAVAKKADRTLGAGRVISYVHSNGTVGAIIELLCETDFVAKNEEFVELAKSIAMQAVATNPKYLRTEEIPEADMQVAKEVFAKEVDGKPADMQAKILEGKIASYFKDKVLMESDYIKDPTLTVRGLIESYVQKFGERIEIGRLVRLGVNEK